jgi:hypothetical protein
MMHLEVKMTTRRKAAVYGRVQGTVKLVRAGGRSIAQTARDLDLTETALCEWVRRAVSVSPSRSAQS